MAATPSLRVIKSFPWRGTTRQWSNRYHFNGGVPADDSHWHTLMDNVTAAEKAIYPTGPTIVQVYGYVAGSEVPVSSKSYSLAGTGGFSTAVMCPGEVAMLVRYSTAARTSKNHPVYLNNYYHSATGQGGSSNDLPQATQKAATLSYANSWVTGFSDGAVTYNRAGPNGASATGAIVETYLTHRDFPR